MDEEDGVDQEDDKYGGMETLVVAPVLLAQANFYGNPIPPTSWDRSELGFTITADVNAF